MKYLSTLLLCLTCFFAYGQFNAKDFEISKFTPFDSNELKFDQVVPNSAYVYWRCVAADPIGVKNSKRLILERIVMEKGDKKFARFAKKKQSTNGFFVNSGPVFSFYYIVAVRKDKTVELIDTDSSLTHFIGNIDNIEEVKLMARRNRLYINLKRHDTGSYRKSGNNYLLYLHDYFQSCLPGDGKDEQSVTAVLTAEGKFNVLKRHYYNK
jgi:hypothetical protein